LLGGFQMSWCAWWGLPCRGPALLTVHGLARKVDKVSGLADIF
jgi:hypothetical protein